MNKLDKILNLIKKTGDKIILMSDYGDEDILIMPLYEYEKMVTGSENIKNLSEEELLNKINRDVALWKENQPIDFDEKESDINFYDAEDLYQDEDWMSDRMETREKIGDWGEKLDASNEPLPWEKFSDKNNDFKFDEMENDEPMKYENIPPPPDVNPKIDIFKEEEKPVIDMSFENTEEEFLSDEKDKQDEVEEFEEEPVY